MEGKGCVWVCVCGGGEIISFREELKESAAVRQMREKDRQTDI